MPSTRPIVDPVLDILEELGYDFDELDGDGYKRSIREAIFRTHPDTGGKTADPEKFQILNEEFKKIRRGGSKPPEVEVKEKKSTIKGAKLLPGSGKFNTDSVKPVDIEKKKEGDSPALMPDRLDNIANTVDSIALLLRRQFGLEKKQQRDTKKQQDKINKDAREDKLEGKPKDKKTGLIPKAIKTPALNFFEKIKTFFTNVVLGAGVIKLFEWLKDPANQENITKFKDFLINNATWIVGGLAALALLPVVGGLVGLIGGIMGGLSMFGLTIPLLPLLLKGILIAAVLALTIAAGNAIKNQITKAISGGGKFRELDEAAKKQLKEAGLGKATNVGVGKHSALVLGPDGKPIFVNMFGKDSLTGREWYRTTSGGLGKSYREPLTIGDPLHESYIERTMGKEKLDEYKSAMNSYNELIFEGKDPIKDKMHKEIGDESRKIRFGRDDDSPKYPGMFGSREEKQKYNDYQKETRELVAKSEEEIRLKYDKIIMEKFPDLFSSVDSSANISEDIKPKEVNLNKNSKSGGVTIIDGGNTGGNGGGNGGAYGGEANASETMISSEDNNNSDIITTSTTYGTGG